MAICYSCFLLFSGAKFATETAPTLPRNCRGCLSYAHRGAGCEDQTKKAPDRNRSDQEILSARIHSQQSPVARQEGKAITLPLLATVFTMLHCCRVKCKYKSGLGKQGAWRRIKRAHRLQFQVGHTHLHSHLHLWYNMASRSSRSSVQ